MLSFINKYTCTSKQLFKISNKIKSKKMVPIIDYVNENTTKDYRNYLEIKDKIIKYDNNYFALKLSSFNINYNKKMAMTKANILIYEAIQKKIPLPESYEGYSFHSYECLPLPTDELQVPVVFAFKASFPTAVLGVPVVLAFKV